MPRYAYVGVDQSGKKVAGEVEAPSPQDATNQIRKMGYFPSGVKEKAAGASTAGATVKPKKGFYVGGVSQKMLTQFTVQLATLQDAGLPLLRSLKILAAQLKPSKLKDVITDVYVDVEAGNSFSESLGKHPSVFDRLYVNMVKAGEAGGVLDTVLIRLATFMEKAQALKRKVIGAMTYPAVVILIAVLILTVIMTKVVPKFGKIFEEMEIGSGLPPQTQLLMSISNVLIDYWYLIPVIPLAIYFAVIGMARSPNGKIFIDRMKLRTPLIGIIFRKAAIARFSRTFGTLLNSGVPILEALNIVKNTVGNEVIATAIQHVHDSIREGESIVGPLSESKVFDMMVINMIEVGEESGELDKMLHKIADSYETEVDALVSSLTTIIEPAIIVFLGVAVGFIVIALFSPLVVLMQQLAK
ncbi:MAG: type II secretion system F family protein [Planctomycetes bacterium]|nr:type II secretion system F family protein [Planctomycetota bacterium]